MGTLAAIGRARPVTDVTNYYLGLKRDQREQDLLQMQQASHAKKMALADIAYRQAKQQEDYMNQPIDVRTTPFWRNLSKSGQQYFTDLITESKFGFSGPRWKIYKTFQETPGLMEEFFRVEDNHYAETINKLENQLMKEESFTKREELKQKINDARIGQFNYLQAKQDMARYMFGREGWQAPQPAMYPAGKSTEGTWGQPQEGLDERGHPVVYITDKSGNSRILEGVRPLPDKGMKIYDPTTGNLLVDTSGGGAGAGVSKPTATEMEQKIVSGVDTYARLLEIKNDWETHPEYADFWHRLSTEADAWQEKYMGKKLNKEEKMLLTKFTSARRKALNNINLYIKEITGAQMSEAEAKRLKTAMPDPGEGVFPEQSYTQFMANLDDLTLAVRACIMRYNWMRENNIPPAEIKRLMKAENIDELNAVVGYTLEDLMGSIQSE